MSHPLLEKTADESIFLFFLPVPNPTVMITSTPASPIRPVGSPVTLTCTVDLSPLLDVPVTVTAQISGPSGVTISPLTNSVMENTTRCTSTAMVSSFGRDQSGVYTCTATVALVTANPLIVGGSGVTGMDSITVGTGKLSYNKSVCDVTYCIYTILNFSLTCIIKCNSAANQFVITFIVIVVHTECLR